MDRIRASLGTSSFQRWGPGPSLSGTGDAYNFACTGVAESGVDVTNGAIQSGALDGVLGAELITRYEPFEHNRVRARFDDRNEVVPDFWRTLDASDSVQSAVEDWCNDSSGDVR